jgi:DNA-binding PadR family transcriptional regulator
VKSRAASLEFALLGLLSQGPLHGYELRKRMIAIYGPFRALSFSVLYPQLRRMMDAKLIVQSFVDSGGLSRRSRIIYELTTKGEEKFSELADSTSSDAFEDEGFEVRFAFFGPTPRKNRVRILEGRLRRLVERAEIVRANLARVSDKTDTYLTEWRRHSLESAEREIIWLEKMIKEEQESL